MAEQPQSRLAFLSPDWVYRGWQFILIGVQHSMMGLRGNGVKGMDNGHVHVCTILLVMKQTTYTESNVACIQNSPTKVIVSRLSNTTKLYVPLSLHRYPINLKTRDPIPNNRLLSTTPRCPLSNQTNAGPSHLIFKLVGIGQISL